MIARTGDRYGAPMGRHLDGVLHLLLAGGVVLGGLAAAAAVMLMGPWALLPPLYFAAAISAFAWPRQTAIGLLVIAVALEPQSVDASRYLAAAVYELPPGFDRLLPLTVAPIELMVVLLAVSLWLPGRGARVARQRAALPAVVFLVPVVVLLGALYGIHRGAPSNLAYIEARGILFGGVAFLVALRCAPASWEVLGRWVMVAAGLLAMLTIYRYVEHVRTGDLAVAVEFAFAHESPIFLCTGLVVAGLLAMRDGRSAGERLGLFAYGILILAALFATQRRAATAVLLIAILWAGFALFPKRPVLISVLAVPLLIGGSVYTAAYWDKEYGATAQPARAIRSQIDPSPRDESSDVYRDIERFNVIETIRSSPVFGVGFGREFYGIQPLPDLTAFWPMQFYTPHQNVLWLWLKVGFVGITVFLSVAALAVSRCMGIMRATPVSSPAFMAAATLSAVVLMYLVYGTIDLAFTGSRPMAPLAAAIALCFTLAAGTGQQEGAAQAGQGEGTRSP